MRSISAAAGSMVDASATISSAAFASPEGEEIATSCSTSGSALEAIAVAHFPRHWLSIGEGIDIYGPENLQALIA